MLLGLGVGAMILCGTTRIAFADEQDEIEAKLRAVVKQQQELQQQADALRKLLEVVKQQSRGSIQIEVKGKLIALGESPWYAVRANDANFPDSTVLVRLLRGEDKNRELDAHLKALAGKVVVVKGYLDCRRVGLDGATLDVYLNSEDQVQGPADK